MFNEANQRVATLGSNCCSFIVTFFTLSSATLKCERVFTMIISAWWLQTSSKLSEKKSKQQPENSEWTTSNRVRIRPKYSATVAFS